MIEAGQAYEMLHGDGTTELFAVVEVVVKGKTDASAAVGYCKLLRLDGDAAGQIMWEWEYKLALMDKWRRIA